MNGFETLKNTAELFKRKDLTASLESGKRYLKTQFQLNCCDSPVRSILHLLFQIHKTYHFKRQILLILMAHVMVAIFFFVMEAVQKIVNENSENQDLQYNTEVAIKAIFHYIKHLMRDAQQKEAK